MEIKYRDREVGSINLSRTTQPTARRGFDLVLVGIPLDFRFEARAPGDHWMLADLSVDLVVQQLGGASWLLGSGLHSESLRSATGSMELSRHINVCCSPRGLAQYETFRDGGPVRLRCEVRGKIFGLLSVKGVEYVVNRAPFFGAMDIEFSREDWAAALRSCGLSASVLVEIPFSAPSTAKPAEGLNTLLDAFEAFDKGGATAWKDSVGHIRPFLERWRSREPLPGSDPRDGSAADRTWKLLNFRDALYKCCHFWVHESKSSCTREDAQLAIATFACLLQAVQPQATSPAP
jgi:hypothetical protein